MDHDDFLRDCLYPPAPPEEDPRQQEEAEEEEEESSGEEEEEPARVSKRGRTTNAATIQKANKIVEIDDDGVPTGINAVPFTNTIGTLVRQEVPFLYEKWEHAKKDRPNAEETIWQQLKVRFPTYIRIICF